MTVETDRDRACELVTVGSRWFGWGHHHTVVDERASEGVRFVRMVRDVRGPKGMIPGPVTKKAQASEWVAAWRVQKFCQRTQEDNA